MSNFLKSLGLLLTTLVILFAIVELIAPAQYSEEHMSRVGKNKARFVRTLDWMSHKFRPDMITGHPLIKQYYPCREGQKRVLLVGDSFIYGKGSVINTTWDAQLASLLAFSDESVCVKAIGKNGWTTKDELEFMEENWQQLDSDFVIMGYVSNDADFHDQNKQYWFKNKPIFCGTYPFKILNWIIGSICGILEANHPTIGYAQWEKRLHSPENLEKYQAVLKDLKNFLSRRKVPLHVILTEESWEFGGEAFNTAISALLDEEEISWSDPLPMVFTYFSPFPQLMRWANPGDGHPGALVHAIFAWYAYAVLCKEKILSNDCEEFVDRVLGRYADGIGKPKN